MRWLLLAAYAGTVVVANWAVAHIGVVPVGFGLAAPAGVYFAGLAFTLRDLIQRRSGKPAALLAIAAGSGLSVALGDGRIAVAAGLAFAVSELVDLALYTVTVERLGFIGAVAASNAAALVIDSAVFLTLAFGSLHFLAGQVVAKAMVTAMTVLALLTIRRLVVRMA